MKENLKIYLFTSFHSSFNWISNKKSLNLALILIFLEELYEFAILVRINKIEYFYFKYQIIFFNLLL